ncbi:MAG: aminoacyl-tRNA hydrolase [Clostridiales bacterium]|nr:aminoacyl-tRNA hydrolase [Clostridiales bacterium]
MYIIAGLGNPGRRYENTRHNLGFITVDLLAKGNGIKVNKIKHKALVGEGTVSGRNVLLLKPQTYMNLSGESIREALDYYKIDIENLLVVYDDIDIPAGQIRVRRKGSAGTHNGMRSVIYQIQTDLFPRVRIGIGGSRKTGLIHFVTGGFGKEEKAVMEGAVTRAAAAIEAYLEKGIEKAMAEFNVKPKSAMEDKESE